MLTVITMKPGHKVDELFDASGRAQFTRFHDALDRSGKVQGVVTPLTIVQFSDSLVSSPDGNPTTSIAGRALLTAQAQEPPGSPAAAARSADAIKTLGRLSAIPIAQRTLDNPEWVKFLVYNNQGEIRKALKSIILNDH